MNEYEVTDPVPSSDDPWQHILEDTSGLPVFLTYDPDGVPVCLSKTVWTDHILLRHPEVEWFKELIVSTIADQIADRWIQRMTECCYTTGSFLKIVALHKWMPHTTATSKD
jgi:hypothetical protein